jgi:hypothetical protein
MVWVRFSTWRTCPTENRRAARRRAPSAARHSERRAGEALNGAVRSNRHGQLGAGSSSDREGSPGVSPYVQHGAGSSVVRARLPGRLAYVSITVHVCTVVIAETSTRFYVPHMTASLRGRAGTRPLGGNVGADVTRILHSPATAARDTSGLDRSDPPRTRPNRPPGRRRVTVAAFRSGPGATW